MLRMQNVPYSHVSCHSTYKIEVIRLCGRQALAACTPGAGLLSCRQRPRTKQGRLVNPQRDMTLHMQRACIGRVSVVHRVSEIYEEDPSIDGLAAASSPWTEAGASPSDDRVQLGRFRL